MKLSNSKCEQQLVSGEDGMGCSDTCAAILYKGDKARHVPIAVEVDEDPDLPKCKSTWSRWRRAKGVQSLCS